MWTYKNTDELYHYGVKGMKWGVRKRISAARIKSKYKRSGLYKGSAKYHTEKAKQVRDSHNRNADTLEKMAGAYEKRQQYGKAELTRRAAAGLRTRGENLSAKHVEEAKTYLYHSDQLKKKASALATKKNVNIGKKEVDSILRKAEKQSYEYEKQSDMDERASKIKSVVGESGYNNYNKYVLGKDD